MDLKSKSIDFKEGLLGVISFKDGLQRCGQKCEHLCVLTAGVYLTHISVYLFHFDPIKFLFKPTTLLEHVFFLLETSAHPDMQLKKSYYRSNNTKNMLYNLMEIMHFNKKNMQ